jgi:hypothetical protein
MSCSKRSIRALALTAFSLVSAGAFAQQAGTLLRTNCAAAPVYHCPDRECPSTMVTQAGTNVEMKTRRPYFLDCPSDYKPGNKVTVVLSLHGGGSYANWQRNYFPAMDVKDKYKLVIITPSSPTQVWSEADDEYLRNMVDAVVGAVGKENVERFVLAGHSQGGMTSNRIICTDYFKDKVDVRISLSGGRIGPVTPAGRGFGAGSPPVYKSGEPASATAPQAPRTPPAAASGPPGGACDYSFIYAIGEYENLPTETSPLADKFACGKRVELPEVIDPKAGYVWDSGRQDPGTDGWGHYPRSGRAKVYQFPNCKEGRVVADVVKLMKGHTEGYEPNVTDKIIELAMSAKGGKIAKGSWTPPAPQPVASPFGR